MSRKRQGGTRASPRKKNHGNPRKHAAEPSACEDDHALAGSFSGWLKPWDKELKVRDRHGTEPAKETDMNAAMHRKQASTSPVGTSATGGRRMRHPQSGDGQVQEKPVSRKTGHRRSTMENVAFSPCIPLTREMSAKLKSRTASGGTQLSPVELSDTSGFETEGEAEDSTKTRMSHSVDRPTDVSPDSETELSAADSTFESQEIGLSHRPPTLQGSNSRRVQHRKEIYERVKSDDGYVWGRDCGLLSTTTRNDDDDLEL
ncbi:MAG: hypothetical protein Q9225_000874 [Loekoesia sp. 1 TL-2023]